MGYDNYNSVPKFRYLIVNDESVDIPDGPEKFNIERMLLRINLTQSFPNHGLWVVVDPIEAKTYIDDFCAPL
jgi:hypothetical protein